jgi:hypothetical protein
MTRKTVEVTVRGAGCQGGNGTGEGIMSTLQVSYPHVTSRIADAEITEVYGSEGPEISDCVAVTIASWWQSPGTIGHVFASFASGQPVEYDDLAEDIYRTQLSSSLTLRDRQGLDCLSTWALDRTDANRRDYAV